MTAKAVSSVSRTDRPTSIASGEHLHALMTNLSRFNRSLTGDGVRGTLSVLKEYLPDLNIHEVISGSKVYDWRIPPEWNVKEAYIKHVDSDERLCDYSKSSLNLVGYSAPFKGVMDLEELRPHLHYLPDQPKLVPYVTSYYGPPYWGFCLSYEDYTRLAPGKYEVVVDTELNKQGRLTYADLVI